MFKVTVETGLDDIKAHLSTCGYEVIDMEKCVRPVQAVVFSGLPLSKPLTQRVNSDVTFLVNATNLTKEQVVERLQEPFC
ncbi:hypothetical protein Ga0466249_004268 [Sporomusaceae bacterium BoRhaA]|uniref:YkuS family protein n=1 Tax=Pelorhabdus rhamnosifermentans TaxID=2772457 RepID=UPI001C062F03|nr:YkuS family protein [Pelorhabdus rhamnosifermentans]MBU2703132.1 hypothetical protein [Pelorhabdus rhamnosifermentans]